MHVTTRFINNRVHTSQLPLEAEYHFKPGKNYLFELPYLSSLVVSGKQAAAFLQGQLSCDVYQVSPSQLRQGILCSLQGRILALLNVIHWNDFQLILPEDLLESTIKSLSRPAVLAKVRLEPNTFCTMYGLLVDNFQDLTPAGISLPTEAFTTTQTEQDFCAHLGHDMEGRAVYLLLRREKQCSKDDWVAPFAALQQLRGSLAWHHHLLEKKHVDIYPNTRGLFLPHRLDLDRFGYINFNKGCYKGQEIIARTHYKAKRKYELHCWLIETEASLTPGKHLIDPTGASVGELLDFSPCGLNRYRVVVSTRLASSDPIQFEEQPHPLHVIKKS